MKLPIVYARFELGQAFAISTMTEQLHEDSRGYVQWPTFTETDGDGNSLATQTCDAIASCHRAAVGASQANQFHVASHAPICCNKATNGNDTQNNNAVRSIPPHQLKQTAIREPTLQGLAPLFFFVNPESGHNMLS